MKIVDLLRLFIRERKRQYLVFFLLASTLVIVFFCNYQSSLSTAKTAVLYFLDKGLNFFTLIPSLSFALLAMFPSFSKELKVSTMRYAAGKKKLDGKPITQLENFLNQYLVVFYLSLINLCLTFIGFILFGEIKDSISSVIVPEIIGVIFLSVFLYCYIQIFICVIYELYMCVALTYNLILNEFSTHIAKK